MYFKAYLIAGEHHQLSGLSGVLHVDLVNSGDKIDQSINLKVRNGIALGDFALADSLPEGNYQVRAYTRWMLNNNPDDYFSQTISVGSIIVKKTAEAYIPAKKVNVPDLQFFPEGGRMVNGVNSKIAFKAVDGNGLGIDVKGELIDSENNPITSFASEHLGMGYFFLRPAEGKTYRERKELFCPLRTILIPQSL
jgi:hypothetical protein